MAAKLQRAEAERGQVAAVLAASREIANEPDPLAILHRTCTEGRRITLARFAVVDLLHSSGTTTRALVASGFDHSGPEPTKPPSSALHVPITSAKRVYGWLIPWNRLVTDVLSDADQRAVTNLGVSAGIAYEARHTR